MDLICSLLGLVALFVIIWIVLGYIVNFGRVPWGHPVRKVYDAMASVINPVLAPIRSVLPPLQMGGVALDLSPIVLILAVSLLRSIIC